MKLSDLVNSAEALRELSSIKFDAKTAWDVHKTINKIDKEVRLFHDIRNSKLKEYGTPKDNNSDSDNINYTLSQENLLKFTEELRSLLDQEVSIEFKKLPLSKINGGISSKTLALLTFLIEED